MKIRIIKNTLGHYQYMLPQSTELYSFENECKPIYTNKDQCICKEGEKYITSIELNEHHNNNSIKLCYENLCNSEIVEGYVGLFHEHDESPYNMIELKHNCADFTITNKTCYIIVYIYDYCKCEYISFIFEISDCICFLGDTMIQTNKGDVMIQNLQKGDMIKTQNGYKPLVKLLKVVSNRTMPFVYFPKNSLYKMIPNKDTYATQWHPIRLGNRFFTAQEFAKCYRFNKIRILYKFCKAHYNLQFENHEIFYANNLEATSVLNSYNKSYGNKHIGIQDYKGTVTNYLRSKKQKENKIALHADPLLTKITTRDIIDFIKSKQQ